jgi:hypothetical protein
MGDARGPRTVRTMTTTPTTTSTTSTSPSDSIGRLASCVGAAAAAPAVWAAASLSGNDVSAADADYLWTPMVTSSLVIALIGAVAALAAAASLLMAYRRGGVTRDAATIVAGTAAYAGLTYATATAPGIGANIGAGLAIFGLVPVSVVAIIAGIVTYRRARRTPHPTTI